MWNIEMRLELNIPGELWNLRNGRIACFFRVLLGLVLAEVLCQPLTAHRWDLAKRSCFFVSQPLRYGSCVWITYK